MNNYNELKCLQNSNSVCIITHLNPDADALCSALSLKELLINKFKVKNVDVFCEYIKLNEKYLPFIDGEKLNPAKKQYEYAISVDSSSVERLGKYANLYLASKKQIVIDHHPTNNMPANIKYLEIVSSTCEIIYSIMDYFNYIPKKETYKKIYAGIITDTNNFMVGAIDEQTFKIASACANKISVTDISSHFFMSTELKNIKLYGKVIQNLQTYHNNKIILTSISKNYVTKNNIKPDDYDGIINKLSTINKANFICFIYPDKSGWYVSLRAKEGKNVAEIAKKMGGGGHVGAAAYLSNKSLVETKKEIVLEFEKQL